MAKLAFNYYLHDDYSAHERAEYIQEQTGWGKDLDEISEKIGRPFYEVTLRCVVDTDTGEVTVTDVRL